MDHHADRAAALASLRARWGAAAPRPAVEVFGALAAAPLPAEAGAAGTLPDERPGPGGRPGMSPDRPALIPLPGGAEATPAARPLPGEPARDGARDGARDADRAIPTGFAELDALLAAGGLPRAGTVTLRGAGSSGATTLALRTVAEAQAGGALVAWVDLPRCLDPVEAVARGVRLDWLAVLVPGSAGEAVAMAGSLLQARAVDVLVLDLASARARAAAAPSATQASATQAAAAQAAARPAPAGRPAARARRPPRLVDQLARLVAFARRSGALLLVLEPADAAPVQAALDGAGLRLELRRIGWTRLGREVVGQRTEVRVAKDHHGAPDRRTTLRLLYAEGGPRDRCLARDELLAEEPVAPRASRSAGAVRAGTGPPSVAGTAAPTSLLLSHEPDRSTDAPPPPRLASPPASSRPEARPRDPRDRSADPRWAAVG